MIKQFANYSINDLFRANISNLKANQMIFSLNFYTHVFIRIEKRLGRLAPYLKRKEKYDSHSRCISQLFNLGMLNFKQIPG